MGHLSEHGGFPKIKDTVLGLHNWDYCILGSILMSPSCCVRNSCASILGRQVKASAPCQTKSLLICTIVQTPKGVYLGDYIGEYFRVYKGGY